MFNKFIKRNKAHKSHVHSNQYTPVLSIRDDSNLSGTPFCILLDNDANYENTFEVGNKHNKQKYEAITKKILNKHCSITEHKNK